MLKKPLQEYDAGATPQTGLIQVVDGTPTAMKSPLAGLDESLKVLAHAISWRMPDTSQKSVTLSRTFFP
jgi:hypothetical protein